MATSHHGNAPAARPRRGGLIIIGLIAAGVAGLIVWLLSRPESVRSPAEVAASPAAPGGKDAPASRPRTVAAETRETAIVPTPFTDLEEATAITGTVVDAAGQPVAGAALYPNPARPHIPGTNLEPFDRNAPSAWAPTDQAGSFRLAGLPAATVYDIGASAPGRGIGFVDRIPTGRHGVRIPLGPTFTLSGTVKDLAEHPIGGATLAVENQISGRVVRHATTSDEAGRYSFPELPAYPNYKYPVSAVLEVRAPGFATQARMVPVPRGVTGAMHPTRREDIFLAREATVSGTVRIGSVNGPVPGATVRLWLIDGVRTGASRRAGGETRTDASGHYQLHGIAVETGHISISSAFMTEGRHSVGFLEVQADGFATCWRPIPCATIEGEDLREDFLLVPSFSLTGRVVDEGGQGVAGVEVALATGDGREATSMLRRISPNVRRTTGADGSYVFESVPLAGALPRQATVGCLRGEECSPEVTVSMSEATALVAPPIVLAGRGSSAFLHGTVVDPDDHPLSGAVITAGANQVVAAADGSFRIAMPVISAIAGELQVWRVEAPGFQTLEGPLSDELPKLCPQRVMLHHAVDRRLTGTVVDSRGQPVPEVVVRALDAALDFATADANTFQWRPNAKLPLASTTTDGSGWFEFAALGADHVHLVVRHPAKLTQQQQPPDAALENLSSDARDVVLRLSNFVLEAPVEVVLRVTDLRTGQPVMAPFDAVLEHDGRQPPRVPGPGLFRFPAVTPGEYRLILFTADQVPAAPIPVVVPPGQPTFEIKTTLDPGLAIEGTVIPPKGRTIPTDLVVMVTEAGPWPARSPPVVVRGTGFRRSGLSPGRWLVRAYQPNQPGLVAAETIAVDLSAANPTAAVTLRLTEGGMLKVVLANADFQAAGGQPPGRMMPDFSERIKAATAFAARFHITCMAEDGPVAFDGPPSTGPHTTWFSPVLDLYVPLGTHHLVVTDRGQEVFRQDVRAGDQVVVPLGK